MTVSWPTKQDAYAITGKATRGGGGVCVCCPQMSSTSAWLGTNNIQCTAKTTHMNLAIRDSSEEH